MRSLSLRQPPPLVVDTEHQRVAVEELEALRAAAVTARDVLAYLDQTGELTSDHLDQIEEADRRVRAAREFRVMGEQVAVSTTELTALWAVHDALVIACGQLTRATQVRWAAQQRKWIERAAASIADARSWLLVVANERSEG